MSLSSRAYDACEVRQQEADLQRVYDWRMSDVQRLHPSAAAPQAAGVFADRLGSAQSQVDVESLLRNQSFADGSKAPTAPAAQPFAANGVVEGLAPRVQYIHRSSDPLSGVSIDRFDPMPCPGMGFQYGYGTIPTNTTLELKNQLEQQRRYQ